MGHPEQSAAAAAFYDVRGFGAAGDGKTIDTPAINRAIDAAAGAGGGTVYFRAGNYLCYSIHLKSKVALYLEQGATIVAADPALLALRIRRGVTIPRSPISRGRRIRIMDTITGTTV